MGLTVKIKLLYPKCQPNGTSGFRDNDSLWPFSLGSNVLVLFQYLDNVVVRVLDVWADPDGDEDVIVELPQVRDGLHPVEVVLVPVLTLNDRKSAQFFQQLEQGLPTTGLNLLYMEEVSKFMSECTASCRFGHM